jgi:hypothetical protein
MAQGNRVDLTRLEQIERRLQVLEDAEAIRNFKARYAALCNKPLRCRRDCHFVHRGCGLGKSGAGPLRRARRDPELLPGSLGHLLFRDPSQPDRPHRGGRRYCASPLVSVDALHRSRRQSGDVARWYRSRDPRPGGWNLDVPSQAFRAADERPVRDRLDDGASRVTGVTRRSFLNEINIGPEHRRT